MSRAILVLAVVAAAVIVANPLRELGLNEGDVSAALVSQFPLGKQYAWNKTLNGSVINTTILRPLFPIIYRRCPGCPFSLDLWTTEEPQLVIKLDGKIGFKLVNLMAGINAVNTTNMDYSDHIFDIAINTTVLAYDIYTNKIDDRLFFHIDIPHFDFDVAVSSIGPVDLNSVSEFLSTVIRKVLVPVFNMNFQGIKLKH